MAQTWRSVAILSDRLQPYRHHLKWLLALPFLVVLVVSAHKIGHSSTALDRNANENTPLLREKRETPKGQSASDSNQGGVTYIRWGRTECPDGADVVYSGVTGGSWYASHGGGANPLCLPMDPIWGTYNELVEKASKLYGAEYEAPSAFNLRNLDNIKGRALQDHNIPCVLCSSQTGRVLLTIPARNLCYDSWKLEYSGLLMSSSPAHQGRTQFICMDESPEADPAGYRDENGALFYNVEGVCGSLPCPPYTQRREITCVVCTK